MTAEFAAGGDTVEVRLLRYPLVLGFRTSEHYEDVFREFALQLAAHPEQTDSVPARLLGMLDRLGRRYPQQQQHEIERERAIACGESTRDMVIHLPPDSGDVGRQIDLLMDEADDYCRNGALLTLAPADDVVAFRKWYLAEVISQIDGCPARPWPGEPR